MYVHKVLKHFFAKNSYYIGSNNGRTLYHKVNSTCCSNWLRRNIILFSIKNKSILQQLNYSLSDLIVSKKKKKMYSKNKLKYKCKNQQLMFETMC